MADGVGRQTVTGILWSYLSFMGSKSINLAALVVLARLLGPADFGLMAICAVVIAYFEIVAKFGLGAALISEREDRPEMEAAVCLMSVATSVLMAGAAAVLAPYVAAGFDQPALVWPLRVIAVVMVIDAVAVVPATLLSKRLQFRRKAVPDLSRALTKALVGIALALAGFGVWALVLGHVAGTLAAAVASFVLVPWWPVARPDRAAMSGAFRFGRHLLLAEVINSAQRNLDALLVGKLLGPVALGIYTLAFRLPDLVIRSFNQIAGSVLHPVIARSGRDDAAMRAAYLHSLRSVALVTFPAGVALCLASDPVVRVLYTPEWHDMIRPMQYLSIALGLLTVDFVPGILYKAMNRTELLLWTSLLKLPLFILVLVAVAPWGVNAIAAAQIGLSLAYMVPNAVIVQRILGVGAGATAVALGPAAAVALAVGGAGLALGLVPVAMPLVQAVWLGGGMALVWAGGIVLFAPEVRTLARARLRRRAGG